MMTRSKSREGAPRAGPPTRPRARVGPWSICLALCLWATGCGGGATDDLPRRAVSGTVTLDGKPLEKGAISFDPEVVPKDPVSVGAIIEGGSYEIAAEQGPTPGTYRVSIRAGGPGEAEASEDAPGMPPRRAAPDPIPARYNARTTLRAEVTADGPNTFDFELTSK